MSWNDPTTKFANGMQCRPKPWTEISNPCQAQTDQGATTPKTVFIIRVVDRPPRERLPIAPWCFHNQRLNLKKGNYKQECLGNGQWVRLDTAGPDREEGGRTPPPVPSVQGVTHSISVRGGADVSVAVPGVHPRPSVPFPRPVQSGRDGQRPCEFGPSPGAA